MAVLGMLLAVLASWALSVFAWLLDQLAFFGDRLGRLDHVSAAIGAAVAAALLAVAVGALVRLRAPPWLHVVPVLGVLSQLALAVVSLQQYGDTPAAESSYAETWWEGSLLVLVMGGAPVLLLVVAAVAVDLQRSVSPDATMTAGPVSSTRSSTVHVTESEPPGTSTR